MFQLITQTKIIVCVFVSPIITYFFSFPLKWTLHKQSCYAHVFVNQFNSIPVFIVNVVGSQPTFPMASCCWQRFGKRSFSKCTS